MFAEVVDELIGLTDSELDARIRANELERRRLDCELTAAVAVAEARQLPSLDGHRSMTAYLRATLNYSSAEASRVRTLARSVDRIDGLGAAWMDGRIGRPQVNEFARVWGNRRVRDHVDSFAPLLLEQAEELSHREFVGCVEHFMRVADADGAHLDRDEQVEHRDAHVTEVGGSLALRAHGGDPLATAEVISIFSRFERAEFDTDRAERRATDGDDATAPLARTAKQRRHDALVAIFRAAATATSTGGPAEPIVNIVIDSATWGRMLADEGLAPDTDLTGDSVDPFTGMIGSRSLLDELATNRHRRCETDRGQHLHPHDVLRAALAGHVRRVVVDTDSTVIDLGRRSRLFTGSARLAAALLVVRCEHPGCELPAEFCEVDHGIGWNDGGTTDQSNARIRCGSHNREKHRKRWRSRRASDGRTFTIRADGTLILPVGVRPPSFDDPDDDPDDDPVNDARIADHIRRRLAAALAA